MKTRVHLPRSAVAALLLSAAAFGAAASAQSRSAPGEPDCRRACLEGVVDRYLQAMAAGTVDPALFAKDARFTENGIEMPLGNEGLWATATGVGRYKLYVPDIETQQIGFLGTVLEVSQSSATGPQTPAEPVGIALRLRVVDGKIAEIEQIAARPERPVGPGATAGASPFPATGKAVEAMGAPDAAFLEAVPESRRGSRADLVRVANYYFDAVERNTGQDYYPFTDDCVRHENGIVTAGPPGSRPDGPLGPLQGCKQQLENGLIGTVTGIRDRRFVAVDRERGVVFSFAFFDHRPINWTWQLGELFKIEGEAIRRIEAIFIRGPYGGCSGWSTYEQCRSERLQDIR